MHINEMDKLIEEVAKAKSAIKDLQDEVDQMEGAIKESLSRVHSYFIETKRTEPYRSAYGTLYLKEVKSVIQPKGDNLRAIFEHFKELHGEEHAWSVLTINNAKLKSEIEAHNKAVEE